MVEPFVRRALEEDLGRGGDITAALVGRAFLRARFATRAAGVVCGMAAARIACHLIDPAIRFLAEARDGDTVPAGWTLAVVEGPATAILTAERTALNFLTLLSGTASLTQDFVTAVEGYGAKIAATRKTLPGLRALQKYAVLCGGGWPHRYGLDDAILIKDNHIAACGSVVAALSSARYAAGHMRVVEVEVDSLAQLEQVLPCKPDVVLLDNFSLDDLRAAVALAQGQVVLEASGGVRLNTVAAIAATGVDVISVGALTHSAPALDIGLDAV
jgi:nicotinate-nucleotide pyrophosphorylase (carboxylating)